MADARPTREVGLAPPKCRVDGKITELWFLTDKQTETDAFLG